MAKTLNVAFASVMFLLTSAVVRADVVLNVTSYSMYNGGRGGFIYQDTGYLPCVANDCTTTGAFLSGGTGQLTNGNDPSSNWDAGQGPSGDYWIGWDTAETNGTDPVVTFNFGAFDTIHSITVWFDNTLGGGDVGAPGEILVDGTPYVPPQDTSGPQGYTISGLDIAGSSVDVQFDQGADPWIMIGQVTFNGTVGVTAVPEPSPVLLLSVLTGFILLIRKRASSI